MREYLWNVRVTSKAANPFDLFGLFRVQQTRTYKFSYVYQQKHHGNTVSWPTF